MKSYCPAGMRRYPYRGRAPAATTARNVPAAVGFLLGYFLSEGLLEGWRYGIAVAAAVLAFLPSVAYDRYARRKELLTYTILRVF